MAFRTTDLRRSNLRVPSGLSADARLRQAVTAAAEPLRDRLNKNGTGTGQVGEPWQAEILELFDDIPELRTACRVTGQAMSQCRLIVARLSDEGEPVPLDRGTEDKPGPDANHPGPAALAKFAGGQGGQSALLDAAGVFMTTTGEFIIAGKLDPETADPTKPEDRLQAYSPEQVQSRAQTIVVKQDNSIKADVVLDETEGYTAIRVWRPHPRLSWKPDSAAHSAIGALQEIKMYDDHIHATGQSRLAGRGVMFIQEDITLPGIEAKDEPGEDGTQTDPFLLLLMEVMSLALADRDSAAAMVPILARVPDVDKAAKLLDFATKFDDGIEEKRRAAIERFAVAVDMPPELLTGYGALQHWTGALISEDWKNSYLSTLMGFICGAITDGWYRKALIAEGSGDVKDDTFIWYDDSSVRTKENTSEDATAAYDRGEIGGDTLRRALGYDKGDKPTPEEMKQQLALMLVLKSPALAPALLPLLIPDIDIAALKEAVANQPPSISAEPAAQPSKPPKAVGKEPDVGTRPGMALNGRR